MKLNLRGGLITVASLFASIRAASSLTARRTALTCLSLSTIIASALAYRPAPTLKASPETCISSSIISLSTSARRSASTLTVSIISALVVHGLYWVSKHRKI